MRLNPKKYPHAAAAAEKFGPETLDINLTTEQIPTYGEALHNMGLRLGKITLGLGNNEDVISMLTTTYTILLSLVDRDNLKDVKMDRTFDSLFAVLEDALSKEADKRDPGSSG